MSKEIESNITFENEESKIFKDLSFSNMLIDKHSDTVLKKKIHSNKKCLMTSIARKDTKVSFSENNKEFKSYSNSPPKFFKKILNEQKSIKLFKLDSYNLYSKNGSTESETRTINLINIQDESNNISRINNNKYTKDNKDFDDSRKKEINLGLIDQTPKSILKNLLSSPHREKIKLPIINKVCINETDEYFLDGVKNGNKSKSISHIKMSNQLLRNFVKFDSVENHENQEVKKDNFFKNKIDDFNENSCKVVYEKKIGLICGFSANTIRNKNEINNSKIKIQINKTIENLNNNNQNSLVHIFSIFDGYGGSSTAEELKKDLHRYYLEDHDLVYDPPRTILKAFGTIENNIINKRNLICFNQCGSSAISVLFIDDKCYIGNVGDSRAIMSNSLGQKINSLSIVHKPNLKLEKERIISKGGIVYASETLIGNNLSIIYRVSPGQLPVSRTIGNLESKLDILGGKPGTIISVPDITSFKIKENLDFILLGSNGLFNKLTNKEITLIIFKTIKDCLESEFSYSEMLVKVTNKLIKEALGVYAKDNVSCIFICLDNLFNCIINKNLYELRLAIKTLKNSSSNYDELYDEVENKHQYNKNNTLYLNQENQKITKIFDQQFLNHSSSKNGKKSQSKNSKSNYGCSCLCQIF